jgi:chloramphenicol-sensitive protein RarD
MLSGGSVQAAAPSMPHRHPSHAASGVARPARGPYHRAMHPRPARPPAATGLLLGLGAYGIWGLLPAFLKLLGAVAPTEILAHRILWSLLLLGAIIAIARRWEAVAAVLRSARLLGVLLLTATLIGGNWLLYIWAVNSAHVLETSLGYFINPLLNVALALLVLGERLSRAQAAAVALAAAGVLYLGIAQGGVPWISLGLAVSFGLYGLFRKMAPVDPLTGLFVETLLMAPAAILYVALLGGAGSFGHEPTGSLLLVLSGVLTAVPLLMFAAAAKRLRYATIGLLQYLAPTMQFLLAVLAFGEPLTRAHGVAFAFIWIGLAIFAADALRAERARRRAGA